MRLFFAAQNDGFYITFLNIGFKLIYLCEQTKNNFHSSTAKV